MFVFYLNDCGVIPLKNMLVCFTFKMYYLSMQLLGIQQDKCKRVQLKLLMCIYFLKIFISNNDKHVYMCLCA